MIKNILKQEKGFTLVEMMIVLLVITVILLVALPNVTKHSSSINQKGCKALVQMVQGQVQAYEMEYKTTPTLSDLKEKKYLHESDLSCPNGAEITIDSEGNVSES